VVTECADVDDLGGEIEDWRSMPAGLDPLFLPHALYFAADAISPGASVPRIPTIPIVQCAAAAGCPSPPGTICNPCLDDGAACEPGLPGDYEGLAVLRFAAAEALHPVGPTVVAAFGADPVLVLLPAGKLKLDGPPGLGDPDMATLLDLGTVVTCGAPAWTVCTMNAPRC